MKQLSQVVQIIVIIITVTGAACSKGSSAKASEGSTANAFGDSIPISNGFVGKVFLLPVNTTRLPDFDTMKPLPNYIYAKAINVPPQSWSVGFPGLRDRFEWFGIEYTCHFKTNDTGNHVFRLVSDDGSRLFIDGKLLIDNDGMHAPVLKTGTIFLNNTKHELKIQYFQGPRYQVALQLFCSQEDSTEQIFPGKDFIVYTPGSPLHFMWILLLAAIILIATIYFIWRKRRSSKIQMNINAVSEH